MFNWGIDKSACNDPEHILPTWFNFDPRMDK